MKDDEKSKEELLAELRLLRAELALARKDDHLLNVASNPFAAPVPVPVPGTGPHCVDTGLTRERKAEEELTQDLIRRRILFDQSRDGIVVLDQNGKVYEANQQFARMLRYPRDEMGQLYVWDWDAQWTRKELEEQIRLIDPGGDFFETRHRRKDGTIYDVEISTNGAVFSGEKLIFCVCRDISQRKHAEEALRKSEEKLRYLSSRLLVAQEEERKRIAHELHDSIGGALSAIQFGLENALERMREGRAVPDLIQALSATTQHAMAEARRIYMDLRPSILDDLGLIAALGWFTRQFEAIYPEIHIHKELEMAEELIPKHLKIIIFRVIQEALHNVAKHSHASRINISLVQANGAMELGIADDGVGFRAEELEDRPGHEGLGLSSMQKRVESTGGVFRVASGRGEGTKVRALWKLSAKT